MRFVSVERDDAQYFVAIDGQEVARFSDSGEAIKCADALRAEPLRRLNAAAIVHRVNTWDAMREALRDVLNDAGGRPKSCGHEYSCVCAWNKATAALAAADGEVRT